MHTYQGSGAVRSLVSGARFTLTEHADFIADYDYLIQAMGQDANDASPELIVLSVAHHAANNLTLGNGQDSTDNAKARGSYHNTFTAVRPDAPIAPPVTPCLNRYSRCHKRLIYSYTAKRRGLNNEP